MNNSFSTRLERIALRLEQVAADLRRLAADIDSASRSATPRRRRLMKAYDPETVTRLKSLGRETAAQQLKSLSQKVMGEILRAVGGTSEEAKRPKEYLIDRILYRLFDFASGHAMLKKGSETSDS